MPKPIYVLPLPDGVHPTKTSHEAAINAAITQLWNSAVVAQLDGADAQALVDEITLLHDEAVNAANSIVDSIDVLLADTALSYPVGFTFLTKEDGFSYVVVPTGAALYHFTTAGGVKLKRMGTDYVVFCYSQSNFHRGTTGLTWDQEPTRNIFAWNGGNWNGDIVPPPYGDRFVWAGSIAPNIPFAYAADIARRRPDLNVYVVDIARGGTGIRGLAGMPYTYRSSGVIGPVPGPGEVTFVGGEIRYSEVDALGMIRFIGSTSLGGGAYVGRIEDVPRNNWIEFSLNSATTDAGTYRTQVRTNTASQGALTDGMSVRLFGATPYMPEVFSTIFGRVRTMLGLGSNTPFIDKVFIWPTEADVNYNDSYELRDFNYLLSYISGAIKTTTDVVMTLPWPYATGIDTVRLEWYETIRRLAQADPARRRLVPLDTTGEANWDGNDNWVHVNFSALEDIGYFVSRSEERGGAPTARVASGEYVPQVTAVANVNTITAVFPAYYTQINKVVDVSGSINLLPAAAGATTQVRLSLPIPDPYMYQSIELVGLCGNKNQVDNVGIIEGDNTNKQALLSLKATGVTGGIIFYNYRYKIK